MPDHAHAPRWQHAAACLTADPATFFPEQGETAVTQNAKAVCNRCPVADECLDYALRHAIKFGVWGGLTEYERRRIRARNRKENVA